MIYEIIPALSSSERFYPSNCASVFTVKEFPRQEKAMNKADGVHGEGSNKG